MTIVLDPLGTPDVHYVRDGVAVINLTGDTSPARTEIPALAGTVIVRAQSPSPGSPGTAGEFEISSSFQIGDVVEIYTVSDFTFFVFPESGGHFIGRATNVSDSGHLGLPKRYQKISATEWTLS